MAFTVADLVALPVLRAARPEVAVGADLHRREVRWVHTSEIYDISPLLRGGEVLLTTGLGLVGATGDAIVRYVESLGQKQVAALMLELGRTFPRAPEELVGAAARAQVPLVLLHGVVPFVEVTETAHRLILDADGARRRKVEAANEELARVLLAGGGVTQLAAAAAELCEAPVGVYAHGGALLAGDDVAVPDAHTPVLRFDAGPWAVLAVAAPDSSQTRSLARSCASAIGISLAQGERLATPARAAEAELLRALASGRHVSRAELVARAGALGFTTPVGQGVVALVVTATAPTPLGSLVSVTADVSRRLAGAALVAEAHGRVLVAQPVHGERLRARLGALADGVDAELAGTVGGRVVRVVAGPVVDDVGGLARSVPAALEAATLADTLALGARTVVVSDLGVYQLLAGATDAALERFVTEQLGPLLEQDARTGSELLATLDTYLEVGLSKARAAGVLRLRRQTLYARLERIDRLLGGDLEERARRTAVDLALLVWRMRSSAAGRVGGGARRRAGPGRAGTGHPSGDREV